MSVIQGRNVLIKIDAGGGLQTILCARSFSVEHTTQLIETTTLTTGKYREYEGQSIDWTVNVGTVLDYDLTGLDAFDLLPLQINFQRIAFEITFTNDDANDQVLNGEGIIESNIISGSTSELVGADFIIRGCGKIPELDPTVDEESPNTQLLSWFYNATGGETTLGRADFIGADIIEVIRNGINLYLIDVPNVPTPNDVVFDGAAGTLEFGTELANGEWIQVVYET